MTLAIKAMAMILATRAMVLTRATILAAGEAESVDFLRVLLPDSCSG